MLIFALRHADRASGNIDGLSDTGKVRAKLLARMLAPSGITHAYCSDAKRTQETIAPLKELLGGGLAVVENPIGNDGVDCHVQAIVTALRALPADSTAAVIGHTNTIDVIIKALSNKTIDPIGPDEFDKLFVLSIPAASPGLTLLKYGAPAP